MERAPYKVMKVVNVSHANESRESCRHQQQPAKRVKKIFFLVFLLEKESENRTRTGGNTSFASRVSYYRWHIQFQSDGIDSFRSSIQLSYIYRKK